MSSTFPDSSLEGRSPSIIAHRGASGYLPEHTAVAKALAYGLGADFIEQDVVATRDSQLVVLHDIWLDDVSDVALKFPDRRRDDGRFYVIDFTLEELRQILLHERHAEGSESLQFPNRFPYQLAGLSPVTLEDEIKLVSGLNATTGRHVGIYPEIKDPGWHEAAGIDLTRLVHDALVANRELISGPVFLQSFDAGALRRLQTEFSTGLPLVQLLNRFDAEALAGDSAAVGRIERYAAAVGLPYTTLISVDAGSGALSATPLAETLAASNLLVHPYTMRRDVRPQAGEADYFAALDFLIHELGVDGLFCDHPDDAIQIRARSSSA